LLRSIGGSAALFIALSSPLAAQHIVGSATGLSGSHSTLDFNAVPLGNNTTITNQAGSGVTFGNATYGQQPFFGGAVFSTSAIYNFTALFDEEETLEIMFASPITGAAFNVMTLEGVTLFEAYLGAQKVDFFEWETGLESSTLFWGFEGFEFDRIVLTSGALQGHAVGIDNLQLASDVVPEPASIALFGFGALALGAVRFRRRRL
jgi:hypothetical protein